MIIISRPLVLLLAILSGHFKTAEIVKGVTVYPFMILSSKSDMTDWLITHERIHLKQQLQLLFIGMILLNIVETIYAMVFLRMSFQAAYLWRSSEQEAYRNQNNSEYLKQRKPFSQFYYVMHKKKFSHQNGIVTYL